MVVGFFLSPQPWEAVLTPHPCKVGRFGEADSRQVAVGSKQPSSWGVFDALFLPVSSPPGSS